MFKIVTLRRTYKYRLYQCDRIDRDLHAQINVAGMIWNHALALQKRYYQRYKKHISHGRLDQQIAKLRMRTRRYAYWKQVDSQATQNVLERLRDAYQRFFDQQAGLPRFKRVKKYKSFTLKQSKWKLLPDRRPVVMDERGKVRQRGIGLIRIGDHHYKFIKHREMHGAIKTVTIKRDPVGNLWVCFSVIEHFERPERTSTGESGGLDYGLKTFLMDNHATAYLNPEFFKQELKRIQALNRTLSHKQAGSNNYRRAHHALARAHLRIADKRRDYHFKLAHELCDQYDWLFFEDLNLSGMKKLWGRKVSDLGFGKFLEIVKHIAFKRGVNVYQIPRFERTTGLCCRCEHQQPMALRDRLFVCQHCGLTLDRDWNAAINIWYAGASACGLGVVRPSFEGNPATV